MGIQPNPFLASFAIDMGSTSDSGVGQLNSHMKHLPKEWHAFLAVYYDLKEEAEYFEDDDGLKQLRKRCQEAGLDAFLGPVPRVAINDLVSIGADLNDTFEQGPQGKETYFGQQVYLNSAPTKVSLVEAGQYSHVGSAEMLLASENEEDLNAVVDALGIPLSHVINLHCFVVAI